MQIWPAIDLRGGQCVRLQQGDYNRETVFSDDPVEMAQRWADDGAQHLHLVDLDGARDGRLVNRDTVAARLQAHERIFQHPASSVGPTACHLSARHLLGRAANTTFCMGPTSKLASFSKLVVRFSRARALQLIERI